MDSYLVRIYRRAGPGDAPAAEPSGTVERVATAEVQPFRGLAALLALLDLAPRTDDAPPRPQ